MIKITVGGERREVEEATTVDELLTNEKLRTSPPWKLAFTSCHAVKAIGGGYPPRI